MYKWTQKANIVVSSYASVKHGTMADRNVVVAVPFTIILNPHGVTTQLFTCVNAEREIWETMGKQRMD